MIQERDCFGKLRAICKSDETTQKGVPLWHCKCECGETLKLSENKLIHRQQLDCGCGLASTPEKQSVADVMYERYQTLAAYRKVPFTLTQKECTTLSQSPCYICGKKNTVIDKHSDPMVFRMIIFSYLRRIIAADGYTAENLRPVCAKHKKVKLPEQPKRTRVTRHKEEKPQEEAPEKTVFVQPLYVPEEFDAYGDPICTVSSGGNDE